MEDRDEYFLLVHARLKTMIHRRSLWTARYKLFWMDLGEVKNYMTYELWRACQTYDSSKVDEDMTIEKYWWACWLNRRWKLARSHYTPTEEINTWADRMDNLEGPDGGVLDHRALVIYDPEGVPVCPVPGLLESRVWRLLAYGYNKKEISRLLDMEGRVTDEIVATFKRPEVKQFLTGGIFDSIALQGA